MMKSIVLIGNNKIEKLVAQRLQGQFELTEITEGDLTKAATYQHLPTNLAMMISLAGPMDVDLVMDAFFSAARQQQLKLERVVMLSTAGIDNEVTGKLKYPGVKDVTEYLREQRYAIKMIDEEEIPYTIFRPVNVINEKTGNPVVINEGEKVPVGNVSRETIANFIVQAIQANQYQNQSIALIETK
ncbi:NAD(P)-binding oxidoreductase [Fructilactobacillus frigidiflavus]|uniref:NAD(P)-binding oxidoreductase n=1 Tax=Fructilactobacillus frigidiflavus TaxID=3242688 RepID=UPI003757555C